MHEWHTNTSRNPLNLIREFEDYTYGTDHSGILSVKTIKIVNQVFNTEEEAGSFVRRSSYGYNNTAYLSAFTTKKLSKAYQNAYASFISKYREWKAFEKGLTIGYGRKSSKVTCPTCGSSINLQYGGRFKCCPVCTSSKIISDSNWKILETKHNMCIKAAENLAREAEKNDVTFVCGIEWHC